MFGNVARRVSAVGVKTTRSAASSRGFFTGVLNDHPGQNPLTEEFPGVPAVQPGTRTLGKLKVTTLSNGLRVASQENCSPVASVGVHVDAGSRAEQRGEEGFSYLLQRLAFKSTQTRSHLRVVRDMEDAGLNLSALSSRDSLVLSGTGARNSTFELVDLLGDTVVSPLFADWEVLAWQGKVQEYDSPVIESDANIALSEATHAAAFQDDTPLGRSSYISSSKLGSVSSNDLRAFVSRNFGANSIVVSAAGVDHDELVSAAESAFGGIPASSSGAAGSADYLGGSTRFATPSDIAYFSLAFEAPSLNGAAKDVAAFRVLQAVLGRTVDCNSGLGDRQSRLAKLEAGDPTVGVATAFTRFYRDAGLFGVCAAANEENAGSAFKAIAATLKSVGDVSGDELTRAKNQAKMAYLSGLCTTGDVQNDIGQQLLLTGARAEGSDVAAAIDAITSADLEAAAGSALASNLTLAAVGGVSNVPRYGSATKLFE